eukprot:TRINITY_DN2226_c0_g1_i15.p1 TRINITY_DN2226_c0_g1~~TRINITY_DN2226_c0_g1_i15.p1  ORF type:complete len:421 (-),score=64.30 TRINITY_DN2226_c0_g1_i15:145-1407(-)
MSQIDIAAQISIVNQELQQIDEQILLEKKEIEQLISEHQNLKLKYACVKNHIQELIEQLADEEMKGNDLKILVANIENQRGFQQKEIEKEGEKVKLLRQKNQKLVDEFVTKCKKQMAKYSEERRSKFKDQISKRQNELDENILKINERMEQLMTQKISLEKDLQEIEKETKILQDEVKLQQAQLTQQTQQQIQLQQKLFDQEEERKRQQEKEKQEICALEYEIDLLCEEMALQEVEIQQLEGQRWRQELQNQDVKRQIEAINRQINAIQAQRRMNAQQQKVPVNTYQEKTAAYKNPRNQFQMQQVQNRQCITMQSMGNSNSRHIQEGFIETKEVVVKVEDESTRQELGSKTLQLNDQKALPKQRPPLKRKPTRTSRKKQHQKLLKMVQPTSGKQKGREEIQDEEDEDRNNQFDLFGGRLQ